MGIYKYILLPSFLISMIVGTEDYLWPTNASKTITTVFGDIRPFRYHTGIDIRTYGINGLDIYAIQDGYISRIAVSSSGYGKVIYIKMKDGNTIYGYRKSKDGPELLEMSALSAELDAPLRPATCLTVSNPRFVHRVGDHVGPSLLGLCFRKKIRNFSDTMLNPAANGLGCNAVILR